MKLAGYSLIGFDTPRSNGQNQLFTAINPQNGSEFEPHFETASEEQIERAVQKAHQAFAGYKNLSGARKAEFLRKIADKLRAVQEQLTERIGQEAALPAARVASELTRTVFHCHLFADVLEEGSWVEARLDSGDSTRKPLPKPDLRSMLRPIGPVTVFGASNFPLAYSVAGGDTISALAAGCPVIVKAHPAHPGTSEIVGRLIVEAAQETGMPDGVFSLLFDAQYEVGMALVRHPLVKAVGFTGSRKGGRALMDAAAARENPIPVYAEMSSVNPIFILPGALDERAETLVTGLHNSVTQGVGQFCTNPGLVFLPIGAKGDAFLEELEKLMAQTPAATMLTPGICDAYNKGLQSLAQSEGVKKRLNSASNTFQAAAALWEVDAETFAHNPDLMHEVFGPSTLVIRYVEPKDLLALGNGLEGQLTATLYANDEELEGLEPLANLLEDKAGRLIWNGFPTGVEVGHAIVHGGPSPSTSDGRTTSVGSRAITRFARAVCFQNWPDSVLPPELQNENPLGIERLINGHKVASIR